MTDEYKAIQSTIETMQKSLDLISEQIREDRKDLNQVKIDIETIKKGNLVIIENQDKQEETLKDAVKEEAQKIPKHTQRAVEKIFDNKPLLKRIKDKFKKEVK